MLDIIFKGKNGHSSVLPEFNGHFLHIQMLMLLELKTRDLLR